MNAHNRRIALAAAAAATLAAAAWVSGEADQAESLAMPAKAAAPAPRSEPPAPAAPPLPAAEMQRAPFPQAAADPFAARSWAPRVAHKAPAPTAPPLPYTYFGQMTEDGKLYAFLQRGQRTYTVARGDLLDREYRVEEVTPVAVAITYLPLNQRQVLHTGSH